MTRIAVTVIAGVIFSVTPARAQDRAAWTFAAAASADWVSTYRMAHSYDGHPTREFREQNPLLTWASDRPATLVATGAAMDVAAYLAWRKLTHAKHKKLYTVGLYVAAMGRAYLAVRNTRGMARKTSE